MSKTIFWHESSANEPGGTARPGRARSLGAAGVAAMPTVGDLTRFGLPPAGRDQRGRLHDHGADRSAVPGAAVLRLRADGGVGGDPGPCRPPQTGAASDAARGPGGDLPAAEHQQAGTGAQDLPLPARRDLDRAGQSGLVLGRHLHPDGPGLSLPGGDHGLGEPCRAGLAAVDTLGAEFCVEALEEALLLHGRPEIFNPDQGSQITSDDFTGTLERHGVTISMDGKGRYMDNIFVERLWRSLKYEEVYLNAYASVAEAKAGIGSWRGFYNQERQHQSLGYRTPRQAYEAECPWICGRSASPTGCAFAHIPTGTTANHRIDIDAGEGRSNVITVAPGAIGAGTEIGRATP